MNTQEAKQKIKNMKENDKLSYRMLNITARIYKKYWHCNSLNEARINALFCEV